MDAQILAAEREAHQRSKRLARGILFGFFCAFPLLCELVMVIVAGQALGTAAAIALILLGIVALGLGLGILVAKGVAGACSDRLGFASPGPWSFGQVYTRAPADQVWAALHRTVGLSAMVSHQVGPTTIEAVKHAFWTPGGRFLIDLRASQDRPGQGVVTIAARPQIPYAYHDLGFAQNTVNALLMGVPGRDMSPLPAWPATPIDRFQSNAPGPITAPVTNR